MTIRVLVVDDHPIVRAGLRSALVEEGIQVVADVSDGSAALAALDAVVPDVALVDMVLPLESGVDITKRLLSRQPRLKVIAFSLREEPALVRDALAAGAKGYISKRSASANFVQAIRQVAEGGSYVSCETYSSADSGAPDTPLSEREEAVLRALSRGKAREAVALELGITLRTLDTYKNRGMHKLQLRSRADLIRFASHAGWLFQADG